MILTADTVFKATLLINDLRTGYFAGRVFYPKGVYWNKKQVILVGDKIDDHTMRYAFPKDSIEVEAT